MRTRGEGFRSGSARWCRLAPPLHALLGAGARRCAATARDVPDRTAFERQRSDHGRARYGRRNRGIRLIYCLHEVPRQLPSPCLPGTGTTRARDVRTLGNHAAHTRRAGRYLLAGNPCTGASKSARNPYASRPNCYAMNSASKACPNSDQTGGATRQWSQLQRQSAPPTRMRFGHAATPAFVPTSYENSLAEALLLCFSLVPGPNSAVRAPQRGPR